MNGFLGKIVGLCLMRMLADMALPEGDSRRWADLGVGLSMMLCMLDALLSLLRGIT